MRAPARPVAAVLAALSIIAGTASCGTLRTPSATACPEGGFDCPRPLQFRAGKAEVSGVLSAARNNWSYAIDVTTPVTLSWHLSGPSMRVVLTHPDGNADGPGIDPVVPLTMAGRYVFSISSNTMAENIYGPFQLTLQLSPLQKTRAPEH